MKKLLATLLIFAVMTPFPAQAAKTVPYKNQKAGQFCKTIDIKKTVKLPDGSKLICLKDGSRARWKAPNL
jgi:hypothetical protein